MARRFRLDPTFPYERTQILRAAASTVVTLIFFRVVAPHAFSLLLLFGILLLGWIVTAVVARALWVTRPTIEHAELLIGDHAARLNFGGFRGTATCSEVLRADVAHVYEGHFGLLLQCHAPTRGFTVVRGFKDYDEVRAIFATWKPLEKPGETEITRLLSVLLLCDLSPLDMPNDEAVIAEVASLREIPATLTTAAIPSARALLVRGFLLWLAAIVAPILLWDVLR